VLTAPPLAGLCTPFQAKAASHAHPPMPATYRSSWCPRSSCSVKTSPAAPDLLSLWGSRRNSHSLPPLPTACMQWLPLQCQFSATRQIPWPAMSARPELCAYIRVPRTPCPTPSAICLAPIRAATGLPYSTAAAHRRQPSSPRGPGRLGCCAAGPQPLRVQDRRAVFPRTGQAALSVSTHALGFDS
jgi:hypothetical protein